MGVHGEPAPSLLFSSLSPHSLLTLSSLSPHSLLTLSSLSPHSLSLLSPHNSLTLHCLLTLLSPSPSLSLCCLTPVPRCSPSLATSWQGLRDTSSAFALTYAQLRKLSSERLHALLAEFPRARAVIRRAGNRMAVQRTFLLVGDIARSSALSGEYLDLPAAFKRLQEDMQRRQPAGAQRGFCLALATHRTSP